jgi:uncharacterized protein
MSLEQKINEDLKLAMKSGDSINLNTIRSIRAQIIELSKRGGDLKITPDDEVKILLAAAKKRKEAIDVYKTAGRQDLFDQETRELEIISTYLPEQMGKEEAEEIVKKIIRETGASSVKEIGKVMPLVMKDLKGKIDGKIIQELVKKNLGE